MTKVSYNEDDVKTLAVLLNSLNVSGLQNMKVTCQMADILDRKSTRLNSSHPHSSRMPSSA